MKRALPANLHIQLPVFLDDSTRQPPATLELHKTCIGSEVSNEEITKN